MNDELQGKLVEILGDISESVARTQDFAVEQLPDIAAQYLQFGIVAHTLAIIGTMLFLIIFVWGLVKFQKYTKNSNGHGLFDDEFFLIMYAIVGGIGALLSVIFCISNAYHLAMATLAPKIYLIQGIADLLK